jgi:linoleoyl-CoA desaturase
VLRIHWWQFLIGYLAMTFTAGATLGLIFQLAHVVEGTDYPRPDAQGAMEDTWLVHQMMTTSNFARRNRFLSWYVGGLNYQIEHHLFPKVCSVHYPAISGVVRQAAAAHGVPYLEQPTLLQAIRSHYRMLKHFGRAADCATPQEAWPAGAVPNYPNKSKEAALFPRWPPVHTERSKNKTNYETTTKQI